MMMRYFEKWLIWLDVKLVRFLHSRELWFYQLCQRLLWRCWFLCSTNHLNEFSEGLIVYLFKQGSNFAVWSEHKLWVLQHRYCNSSMLPFPAIVTCPPPLTWQYLALSKLLVGLLCLTFLFGRNRIASTAVNDHCKLQNCYPKRNCRILSEMLFEIAISIERLAPVFP